MFPALGYPPKMPEDRHALTPASAEDLAEALAYALRFEGRKRVNDAGDFMAAIVAKRLVRYLDHEEGADRGGAALRREHEGR